MALVVRIDKNSCQSSGNCVAFAPTAFRFDDDDLGDVLPGAVRLDRERLLAAARRCPALAITILDEDGREIGIGD
jgi:ferredoxin